MQNRKPETPQARAFRLAYQRMYKIWREGYLDDPEASPNGDDWPEYLSRKRARLKAEIMGNATERGPYKDHSTFTPRQLYQAEYQKARRKAEIAWNTSEVIRKEHGGDFSAYWRAHRASFLPEGFCNRTRGRPADTGPETTQPAVPKKQNKYAAMQERFDAYMDSLGGDKPVAVVLDGDPEPDTHNLWR